MRRTVNTTAEGFFRTQVRNSSGDIASALPFALAPALAPVVLALTGQDYGALYLVAGGCALVGAAAIVPIKRVR